MSSTHSLCMHFSFKTSLRCRSMHVFGHACMRAHARLPCVRLCAPVCAWAGILACIDDASPSVRATSIFALAQVAGPRRVCILVILSVISLSSRHGLPVILSSLLLTSLSSLLLTLPPSYLIFIALNIASIVGIGIDARQREK